MHGRPALADRARPADGGAPGDGGWEWFERHRDDVLRLVTPRQFDRLLHAVPFLLGRPFSSRTEVLNCLVSRDELDRYLEIGVHDRDNFDG